MPNAVWPLTLTQYALLRGLSEEPPNNIVSSDTDIGPPKVRRRSTSNIRPINITVSLKVNDAIDQVEILDLFYIVTLASGTLPFDWKHPRTQADVTFMFSAKQRPQYRHHRGTIWHATLQLEVQP